jgi:hydrogenase 3 maturation protease
VGPGLSDAAGTLAALEQLRHRRWLLLGIGNDMRGDDAFGPLLARRLRTEGLPAIDGGLAPENSTGPIRRAAPDVLILADAAELGEPPGTVRLLRPFDLAEGATSTHDPGLRILHYYLTADMPMDVVVLAAQPAGRELGDTVSPALLRAIDEVATQLGSPAQP